MRKHTWILSALLFIPFAGGCAGSADVSSGDDGNQSASSILGDTTEVSLAELLQKPRAELAELTDEWLTRAQLQEKGRKEGRATYTLLPQLRLPLVLPVWREAKYDATAGIILPPYAKAGEKDSALALHLARFGDVEAARKLASESDKGTAQLIEAAAYERNYPAEWSRLVGVMLHTAQARLATGDLAGGSELVSLHKQLREVLDAKAAKGQLGSVLLAQGRVALEQAANEWKEAKQTDLAEQATSVLAAWGDVPARTLPAKPGASRAEMSHLLASPGQGFIIASPSTGRALDLLALPYPGEGLQAVIAFFDGKDKFSELLITYRIQTNEHYTKLKQFAHHLEDHQTEGADVGAATGISRKVYQMDGVPCEVALITSGAGVGAMVRLGEGRATGSVPRALGEASLDRTFEYQRFVLAPEQRAEKLIISAADRVARVANPLPGLKPAEVTVQQEPGQNLVSRFAIRYENDGPSLPPLHQFLQSMWSQLGPAQVEAAVDAVGAHLALSWKDAKTVCHLRLPFDPARQPELEIRDHQGGKDLAARAEKAVQFDQSARAERVKSGKPIRTLPRGVEQAQLGLTRTQLQQLMPEGRAILKQELKNGIGYVFAGDTAGGRSSVVRQVFVRFNAEGLACEVRARYFDAPQGGSTSWIGDRITGFKKAGGAPTSQISPWATASQDLGPRNPAPTMLAWQDDSTRLTCQRDIGVLEVCVRDCPFDQPEGALLPPLQYLTRGPENVALGATRNDLIKQAGGRQPVATEDGALILPAQSGSSYDVVLVWLEDDKVKRIVARHSLAKGARVGMDQMSVALTEAWGREMHKLGWPIRQDFTPQDKPLSLSWLDELTRVRLFWQENNDGGCRLFSEWTSLPRP